MIDASVTDAVFLHATDDLLKGLQVFRGIAVHLDIADVPGVGKRVIGRLDPDLIVGGDREIHRHMEGVGVIVPVGDARDRSEAGLVQFDEAAGEALRRGCQQGKVEPPLRALFIHPGAHMGDDLQAQYPGLLALAMVLAGQALKGLGQADEAHGQRAVPEHLAHLVVPVQLVGIQPNALPHEEGVVAHVLAALDLKTLQQLSHTQVQHPVQPLEEQGKIPLGLDGQTRQVDGGEAQVAPAVADLPAGIVHVADDPGTAAHVGDLRLRVALLIILQVEGGVQEGEVWKQAPGGAADGQLEQVVVGLAGVVIDPFLHPEDLNGENGGLPAAQPGLGGQHDVFHHHAPLRGGIHAVIDGREGGLGPGPGVHGVQVVDQGLHGLIGGPVGLLHRPVVGKLLGLLDLRFLPEPGRQRQTLGRKIVPAALQRGLEVLLFPDVRDHALEFALRILQPGEQHQRPGQVLPVKAHEGLFHPVGHAVIEVDHALSAVLVVLVGLDGDTAQGGIGGDVVGLPQGAVAGGKAAFEQLPDVDLAAGGGQGKEVQVVDMDVSLPVRPGMIRVEHEHIVELLGSFRAELEHAAHGGIPVDVGVLPLQVGFPCGGERDVLIGLHQAGVHLPGPAALVPIQDVGFGGLYVAVVHQHPLHQILDVLHVGLLAPLHIQDGEHLFRQALGSLLLSRLVGGVEGLGDGLGDLSLIKVGQPPVPLPDLCHCHLQAHPFSKRKKRPFSERKVPFLRSTISCGLFSISRFYNTLSCMFRQGRKQKARSKNRTCFLLVSPISASVPIPAKGRTGGVCAVFRPGTKAGPIHTGRASPPETPRPDHRSRPRRPGPGRAAAPSPAAPARRRTGTGHP